MVMTKVERFWRWLTYPRCCNCGEVVKQPWHNWCMPCWWRLGCALLIRSSVTMFATAKAIKMTKPNDPRFVVVPRSDPRVPEWERSEDDFDFRQVVIDTETGEILGGDGGEPEDQTLYRDWKWVVPALNAVDAELRGFVAELKSLNSPNTADRLMTLRVELAALADKIDNMTFEERENADLGYEIRKAIGMA